MTLEQTEMKLKEMLSQGASQEEMLRQLSLAEGCGLKLRCQEQIVAGSDKKVHRLCGYVYRREDPAENVPESLCGKWMCGGCPGT